MSSPASESIISNPVSSEQLSRDFGDRHSFVVRAGAGAGKTTELVARVLGLAKRFHQEQGRWPHLVVTTFTRKATQELRERLMQKALATGDMELIAFVQRPSFLHISTIHGVLAQFLSQAGSHLGLSPRFQWIDDVGEVRMIKKILRQILEEESADLDALLDEVQLRVLIKALQECFHLRAERGQALQPVTLQDLQASLQKRVQAWIERACHFLALLEGQVTGEKWQEYQTLLHECVQKMAQEPDLFQQHLNFFMDNKPSPRFRPENSDELKEWREDLQKQAKALGGSWIDSAAALQREVHLAQSMARLAEVVFQKLWEAKMSQSTLTMSDLESVSLGLCHAKPEAARDFAENWDYWMVDEYQDTSPRQVELLRFLQGDRPSFTVGDPQQSIYLFRGARTEVFLQKEDVVRQKGGHLLRKMVNYRSQPELLRFLNHFFQALGPQFSPMEADPAKPAQSPISPVAEYWQCGEDVSMNSVVLRRCREWMESGVAPEAICVLARTNRHLQELAAEAERQGVAVQVHASSRFFERREIQDALALLKFLCNPHDNRNLLVLLRSPWFRIPDSLLVPALANLGSESHWLALHKNLKDARLEELAELRQLSDQVGLRIAWERGLQKSGLLDLAKTVDPSGRREANLWKLVVLLREEERKPGFRFLDFAEKAEPSVAEIEEGGDADATPVEEPQRVNLMTVHASKGLQFRHVIVAAIGDYQSRKRGRFFIFHENAGRFALGLQDPQSAQLKTTTWADNWQEELKKREQQEYDRVLYVALTRAQESVALVWQREARGSWAQRMWRPQPQNAGLDFRVQIQRVEKEEDLPVHQMKIQTPPPVPPRWQLSAQAPLSQLSVSDLLQKTISTKARTTISTEMHLEQALHGVRVHRMLESLRYKTLQPKPEDKPWTDFIRQWQGGRLLRWIQTGEVEWGFCVALRSAGQSQWIQGQIDLWSREGDQVWVIDYKTGSESQIEKAFQQLDIYAWALQQTPHAKNAQCQLAVVYPHLGKVQIRPARSGSEMTSWLQERLETQT